MTLCDGKNCQSDATIAYKIRYGSRSVKVKRFLHLCDDCYMSLVGVSE